MSYTDADLLEPILDALRRSFPRPMTSVELRADLIHKPKLGSVSSSECYRAAYTLVSQGKVMPAPWNGMAAFTIKTGFNAQ